MAEENTQTPAETGGEGQPERTFTQSELDAILKDRLKRVEEKYTGHDDLKKQLETLQAKEKEREEAEMTEMDKLKKSRDELKEQMAQLELERDEYKNFKSDWEKRESEKVEKLMEGLTDNQKTIINNLPLSERVMAIEEFKASKTGPGNWGKGGNNQVVNREEALKAIYEKRDRGDKTWLQDYEEFKKKF